MQARPLLATTQFAPKLRAAEVLQADCVEWRTATEGSFQLDGANFKFQRVWLQARRRARAGMGTCVSKGNALAPLKSARSP